MKAALIAAGVGERLRAGGVLTPKPLVIVHDRPLVDWVLGAVAAAGIGEVACIFNADFDAVEEHCRRSPHGLRLDIVRRSTPSSMESLFALAPHLGNEPFLLLTVDAVFAPATLSDFLAAAAAHGDADVVLAVSRFVDDEKPLRVAVEGTGKVTAVGEGAERSPWVTAGFYVLHPRIFAEIEAARAARLGALRQFFAHLRARGYRICASAVAKSVDVDRPHDIAVAEEFVRGGFRP